MKRLLRIILGVVVVFTAAACQKNGNISQEKPTPRLISIVPQTVWSGCTAIISGMGFSELVEDNIVSLDGRTIPVERATTNRLTITMPEHELGHVKISVRVGDKTANEELDAVYAKLPELVAKVTGMTPVSGFVGDIVTIFGENFAENSSGNVVTFGGIEATILSATRNTIKVTVPEHPKGAVDVQVVSGGQSLSVPSQFTYMAFEISSNYPIKGAEGDVVTITGDGFSTIADENIVMVGDKVANVKSATKTSLVVVMPDNPKGDYVFSVTVGGKTVIGGQFEYGGSWRFETLISGYSKLQGMALASDGTFWVTRREAKAFGIYKYNPDGNSLVLIKESKSGSASETDLLAGSFPWGADVGPDGKLYFATKGTAKILTCDAEGNISEYEIKGLTISNPMTVLVSQDGCIYVLCRAKQSTIHKIKDNVVVKTWSLPAAPTYGYETMCFNVDKSKIFVFGHDTGDIQLIDLSDESMNRIAGTGAQHTNAATYTDGMQGDPLTATVRQASGAICAADGTIYFTDSLGKTIRAFRPAVDGDYSKGTIETILGVPYDAKTLPYPNDIALAADGKTLYYLDNKGLICKVYYK